MDAKPCVGARASVWIFWTAITAGLTALLPAAPIVTYGFAAEATKPPETPPPAPNASEESSKLQNLAPAEAASVLGRPVRGPDGHDVGRIVDVLVDQAGHPRAAVIDFGGFMGVGSRKIAVDWHLLHFTP